METPAQRCARIVGALEDLVAQEAAALANRDFAALNALQERTGPLIDFIASIGVTSVTELGLRARISALHSRRQQTSRALAAEIERTRLELEQTRLSQRRVAKVAPVYGQAAHLSRRQLHGVG